jgi:hypothetical protein
MPRGWLIALGALILVLLASSYAFAETEEDTVRLLHGDALAIAIDNTAGEDLWIEYHVEVVDGPDVNVWFTDEEGYTEFFDDIVATFSYYPDHSDNETSFAEDAFSWDDEGIFYVIIDNDQNDARFQNVSVEYNVTWEPYGFESMFLVATLSLIIVIVIVVILILVLFTVKRGQIMAEEAKRAEEEDRTSEHTASEDDGRPQPPEPYPEWVVKGSKDGGLDDDASGWDPARDEPED